MSRFIFVWAALLFAAAPLRAAEAKPFYADWFKRKSKTQSYLESSRMAFALPRFWKGPAKITGGVAFEHPSKDAKITAAYLEKKDAGYMDPVTYRRFMREVGIVGDAHMLERVEISSRPAYRVRFREYSYPPEYVVGTKVEIDYAEILMVPDPPDGIYVFRFDSSLKGSRRYGAAFDLLVATLVLPAGFVEERSEKRDVLGRVVESRTLSGALNDKLRSNEVRRLIRKSTGWFR